MTLADLGWRAEFAAAFHPYTHEGFRAARVTLEYRNAYRVRTPEAEYPAEVTGRFRHAATDRTAFPVVGDWVVVAVQEEQPPRALIHAVLPRHSQFLRKEAGARTAAQPVATNVDTVFLVCGLDHNYNLRRLERYLALAWESGAAPVVLLTKADLCRDLLGCLAAVEAAAPGVPVHALSAFTGYGLAALTPHLQPGQTVALLGSSGVGKSTIINALLGQEVQRVSTVREWDSHGRHTTTHRQLFALENGALVIDTPGMRELQLWHADEGVADTFIDIEALATDCRFTDCRHEDEPGCRVREALRDGTLDAERFESYRKLRKELAYLERREDQSAAIIERQRWKAIHKEIKRMKKR